MLEITNLHVTVEGKEIIKGIDLAVEPGKSTLAYVMTGRDGYEVTGGEILYQGHTMNAAMSGEDDVSTE
jgi:Fe-S cluster assembly ATP-binding protein